MLEMKITITAPDLAMAINNLAAALNGGAAARMAEPTVAEPAPQIPTPTETIVPVAVPTAAPVPTTQTIPSQTAPVPTAAPQYTLEMIATAGTSLIDAGKMEQLVALLAKFGVDSLTSLAPEHYGAVASELRALGARI